MLRGWGSTLGRGQPVRHSSRKMQAKILRPALPPTTGDYQTVPTREHCL